MQSAYKFHRRCSYLLSALFLIGITAGVGYSAAFDAFLEIEGIPGESEIKPGAIEIQSYSWGLTQTGSMSGGSGGGTGKVSFQDFHFVKKSDKSSPKLMERCCTGTHFPKAILTLRYQPDPSPEGTPADTQYMQYTLENVLVSSYSTGGATSSGDPLPLEQFSLNFTKITYDYMRTGANPAEASAACVGSATQ